MPDTPQTYASHAHRPTLTNVAALFALAAFVLLLYALIREPSVALLAMVSLSVAVLTLVAISRVYTVRLQDRIIRLEMRVRLDRLGLGATMSRLTTKQLTALRFASDSELGPLIDRTLAEGLTPDQIKRAVTDWQPDRMRT